MLPLLLADHTAQAQQVDALSLRRGFQDLSRPQVARDYLNYWMWRYFMNFMLEGQ